MSYPIGSFDQRGQPRVSVEYPVTISVGSQLTVKGQLKDLSLSSAFIKIKNNIYLSINDEIGISILYPTSNDENLEIKGMARISRIVPGEGLAVYFTKLDDDSQKYIKKILPKADISNP